MEKMTEEGDVIIDLPKDTIPPTLEEKEMMSWLYGTSEKQLPTDGMVLWNESRNVLLAGVLFFIFSFPMCTDICQRMIPITRNSTLFSIIALTIIFMVTLWILQNISLLFKKR